MKSDAASPHFRKMPFGILSALAFITIFGISCSGYRPVVFHDNTFYLGWFYFEKDRPDEFAEYYSLRGGGLVIGRFRLGVGYYAVGRTLAKRTGDYHARTPLAEIYAGTEADEYAKRCDKIKGGLQ